MSAADSLGPGSAAFIGEGIGYPFRGIDRNTLVLNQRNGAVGHRAGRLAASHDRGFRRKEILGKQKTAPLVRAGQGTTFKLPFFRLKSSCSNRQFFTDINVF
jgi:hypothetical protein